MKLLLPFSWLYGIAIRLRNKLFDWGMLKSRSAGVPVISVGNLTVGGTGKTPLVEFIVEELKRYGKRVAVVSRGYKRKSKGVQVVSDGRRVLADAEIGGDEPVQIAQKYSDAIVVVGEKRVEAARKAVELGAEVIVLDDGFQHRYLKRDLDIVVLDSTTDVRIDALLPAGRLREPVSSLQRASVVAFSKVDRNVHTLSDLQSQVSTHFSGSFITYDYSIKEVRRGNDGGRASMDVVKGMKLFAFSGIGKHDAFMLELSKNGFAPVQEMRFPDHHLFSETDVLMLASFAKSMQVDACITTEKDIMRLRGSSTLEKKFFDEVPVFYLVIEVEVLEGKDAFSGLLQHIPGEKGSL